MEEYKGSRTLSKCRYATLTQELRREIKDEEMINKFLDILKHVLKFDPNANTYEPIKEKLEKTKVAGVSTYQALNRKKYYEKNKDVLNKRRTESRKVLKGKSVIHEQ